MISFALIKALRRQNRFYSNFTYEDTWLGPNFTFFLNFFWPRFVACRILVPQPEIKPLLPALGALSLNLMCVCVCVCVRAHARACIQLCLILCDSMDCSPPGSSVHGIFQAIILEWVAISYSRGSSWLRDQTHILASPALAAGFFTTVPLG